MGGETNPISPMQGSTSNPTSSTPHVVESGIGVDNMANDQNEGPNVREGNTQSGNGNGNGDGDGADKVELKRKRQRTSTVWEEFVDVTLPDGKQKAECIHCKTRLAKAVTGTTTTYKRHLESCAKRKQYQRVQQMLNFPPATSVGDMGYNQPHPFIGPDTKYDPNKMREAIANWIMGTEQPFTVVEDDLFVYMMKRANPLFQKISRATAKADCWKVYEHERKKLKDLTNAATKISLTTDCWKSSHQKIEYMVITGHFIDQNWRLQKRVLSFVHVPPPRTGLDIADGIYKCLKDWEIEGKIFSISVDNAAYNDRAVNKLQTDFNRVKKLPCGGRLFHVRCCAHILNLLVKDGLSKIDFAIEEVREAVKYINHSEARRPEKSELAMYLEEGVHRVQGQAGMQSFNALEWWKMHKLKYPVLSQMAMNVLAIPISTVASESTFSAGGRVIDPYRSLLAPDTVQMLICEGDWIRQMYGVKKNIKKEEIPTEVILPAMKKS